MERKVKDRKVKPEHDLRIPGATPEALVKAVVQSKPVPKKVKGKEK